MTLKNKELSELTKTILFLLTFATITSISTYLFTLLTLHLSNLANINVGLVSFVYGVSTLAIGFVALIALGATVLFIGMIFARFMDAD